MSDFTTPGKLILYVIRYEQETANLRIICVKSTKPCNLRCNIDLIHNVSSTFIIAQIIQCMYYRRIPKAIKLYTYVTTKLR